MGVAQLFAHAMHATFSIPPNLQHLPTPMILCLYREAMHAFVMFYAHVLHEWAWSCVHMYVATFTKFAQNSNIRNLFSLYGSIMHVATL